MEQCDNCKQEEHETFCWSTDMTDETADDPADTAVTGPEWGCWKARLAPGPPVQWTWQNLHVPGDTAIHPINYCGDRVHSQVTIVAMVTK